MQRMSLGNDWVVFFMLNLWIGLATYSSHLKAKDQIIWAKYKFEPVHIEKGIHKNQGVSDLLFTLLQREMPEYDHIERYSNVVRILTDLKRDTLICASLLKTPQRERELLFSAPSLLIPNHSLQFLVERTQALEQKTQMHLQDSVSLAQLAANKSVLFGVIHNRSHGPAADKILAQHSSQIVYRSGGFDIIGLTDMMTKNRFDFTIEYPYVSYYELSKTGEQDKLYSVSISESRESLYAYISCTRGESGQQVIDKINQILLKQRPTKKYREMIERWLPHSALEIYRKRYSQFIKQAS